MNQSPYPNSTQQPPYTQYPNQGYPQQQYPGQLHQYTPQQQYPNQPPQYAPLPQYQPPMQPKKKKSKLPLIIIGIIVLVVIIVVAANAGHPGTSNTGTTANSSSTTPNSSSTTTTNNQNANQHFKVGDQVTVGTTWKAVVNSVTTDDGGQFASLKDGDTYLVIDISLTNLSSKEQTISSILNFTLKDSTGQKYNEGIDANTGATLDGKVEAGGPLRGVIAYEVPSSMKSFTLAFAPNFMDPGQTVWDLSL